MHAGTFANDHPTRSDDGLPTTPTATDRLAAIYQHPGPYTSVYLATLPLLPDSERDMHRRWTELRKDLASQGAPLPALEAIAARLALPAPDDTAAVAILAAANGSTVVDHGAEPPAHDYAVVDTLPYAAPLLEWHQRRLAHLVVTLDDDGADIAIFGLDHYVRLDEVVATDDHLAHEIERRIDEVGAELVVLAGHPAIATATADRLRPRVPHICRIVTEPLTQTSAELADVAVRHVSDTTARATVRLLRERRFLASHDAAVDGTAETLRALDHGTADYLLIHDDPTDQRRCWIGPGATAISLEQRRSARQARLVDAAIRSAVLQDIPVHIIPRTGATGPADDTAALTAAQD